MRPKAAPTPPLSSFLEPYAGDIALAVERMRTKHQMEVEFAYLSSEFARIKVWSVSGDAPMLVDVFIGSTMRGPLERLMEDYP